MKRIIIVSMSVALVVLAFGQAIYKGGEVRLSPRQLNYQGYLTDTLGNPVTNPAMSITMGIWSASSGGTQLWFENQTIDIQKGIFNIIVGDLTTLPDSIFTKNPNRWLELTVGGVTLSPRTRIVSTAYAYTSILADTAGNAKLLQGKDTVALDARYVNEGQVNSITTPMIIDTAVTMAKIARAGASTNQVIKWNGAAWAPANDISSADNHWTYLVSDVADTTLQMGGRWGLARPGNVLFGNADSTHVNFGVACTTGSTGLNYKYCTVAGGYNNICGFSYSAVGGGLQNSARSGYVSIAGGYVNNATGQFGAIAGGRENLASNTYTVVAGGYADTVSGYAATIGGGYDNLANIDYTTVAGGRLNSSTGSYATVGGGYTNNAGGLYSAIAGGSNNNAGASYSIVGGGRYGSASSGYATVGGGYADTVKAVFGFIGSGYGNLAGDSLIDTAAVVAGGYNNTATGRYSLVGGGWSNTASGYWATVAGGNGNDADTSYATVVGGVGNTASGYISFIGGGQANTASGYEATVAGGRSHDASGSYATIGGGYNNTADSTYSTIGGGNNNIAHGNYSFIGGGLYDTVLAFYGSVVSGYNNKAGAALSDTGATVCGGYGNAAIGMYSFVGGGYNNMSFSGATISGGLNNNTTNAYAAVGGGQQNTADYYATVAGGSNNSASSWFTTVGGGVNNIASNYYATVAGGLWDTSAALSSFTAGNNSTVPDGDGNSAAFNGQTSTASGQTRVGILSKASGTFTIDHPLDPENKILNHYFVESPGMTNIYEGEAVLDGSGRAEIILPVYFDALNRAPRIQLTGIGTSDIYVAEKVKGNRFIIGGKPGTEVYWMVTADRKDPSAEITRIIMPVEQVKEGGLVGRSLDDEFLVSTMAQLERMGKASGFKFRHASEQKRYEEMKKQLEKIEK